MKQLVNTPALSDVRGSYYSCLSSHLTPSVSGMGRYSAVWLVGCLVVNHSSCESWKRLQKNVGEVGVEAFFLYQITICTRTVLQSSSSLLQAKKPVGCMRLAGTSHLQRGRWRCSQVMIQHRTEHSLSGIMSKLVIFPAQDLSISLTADSYPIPRGRSATQECHWADKSRQPTSTEINNRSRLENIWSADIWSELGDRISNILITSRNIISSRHLFAHSPCLLH